jgi:hypothetical protein
LDAKAVVRVEALLAIAVALAPGLWEPDSAPSDAEGVDVLWVVGQVTLEDEEGDATPLEAGQTLRSGGKLTLAEGSEVFLSTGGGYLIDRKGPDDVDVAEVLSSNLAGNFHRLPLVVGTGELGAWPDLAIRALIDDPERRLRITSPHHTSIVAKRPKVQWKSRGADGAFNLRLDLLGADGGFREVERWKNVRGRWFEFSQALDTGRFYRLTIEGAGRDGGQDQSVFYVLAHAERIALEQARRSLDEFLGKGHFKDPVPRIALARWLDAHGLYQEAALQWERLHQEFPSIATFDLETKRHGRRQLVVPHDDRSIVNLGLWLIELVPLKR